jgi:hypothetical protein
MTDEHCRNMVGDMESTGCTRTRDSVTTVFKENWSIGLKDLERDSF